MTFSKSTTDKPSYTYEELSEKNKAYVWHPFTQMKDYLEEDPVIIEWERKKAIRCKWK